MSENMNINRLSISSTPNNAPHIWAAKHWNQPTWCKFCTKFIWGLGYQGFHVNSFIFFQVICSKIFYF